MGGENAGQVQAEETTSTDFSQYGAYLTGLKDQNERGCTFIAKSASSVENSETYIKEGSVQISSDNSEKGGLLFDGLTSSSGNTGFLHIENNQGNRQDQGDYVGLIFEEAIDMQSVRFTLGSGSDAYKTSKLQYLQEGATEWQDVEGEDFENVSVCERVFEEPVEAVKGIRLVCIATETQYGWLRVYEIEVGQAVQVKSQYTNIAKGAIITTDADIRETGNLVDGNESTLYKFSDSAWAAGMEKSILLSYGDARAMDSFRIVFEHVDNEEYNYQFEYSILAKNTSTDNAWTTIADHVTANRTINYQQVYNQETAKQFNMVKIVMHSCTTNTSNGYGWAAIAAFEVYGATTEISTSMMSATAGSAHSDSPAAYVLDGDINSIWHSNWSGDTASHDNHYLIFTFNETMSVDSISYKARPNVDENGNPNNTGNINGYTLWVSEDATGDNWTQITLANGDTTGSFEDTIEWQKATFSSVTAKRIKLKVESAYRDTDLSKNASAAEVRFTGTRINPSESDTAMWKVNDVQRSEIASVTAGSACPTAGTGDSDASASIDGNTATWWHTNWKTNNGATSDQGKIHKSWLDMKFTETTIVDGIRVLPRLSDNGIITAYEVWVSNVDEPTDLSAITDVSTYTATWQKEYTKVCEGTWLDNGNGTDKWKVVSFEPVQARHVRLVATETYNKWATANAYASMVEFRATKPTETYDCFQGGSLRMDDADTYDMASMRYEYQFPTTLNGMTLQENAWSWKYGTGIDESGKIAGDRVQTVKENHFKVVDGTCYSNLVFTKIAKANYNSTLYAQLVIPYSNTDGETLKVYTSVENRSVAGVAQKVAEYGSTEEQKAYATELLEAMSTGN